ncbi:MAG: hypothetical protein HRT81_06865 [Henriciella sp.]|nr:hypothetical protein [Henriciella sp.]
MEIFSQFYTEMTTNSPTWVLVWVNAIAAVLTLSIAFSFSYREARWILLGVTLGMLGTVGAYALFGFTRLLGLGHILFWTPTLIYIVTVRGWKTYHKTLFSRWLILAAIIIGISLAFDVVDLLRWILGERAPIRI